MVKAVINLGVIGSGPIASKHLDVLAALDGVQIAALCSRRAGPRDALARQYGVPAQFEHVDALLQQPMDGVLVLVAPDALAGVAAATLKRGIPTFLEKPPGLTFREAEALAELAERRRVPNQVGLNRRFYSVITSARTAIEQSGALFGVRIEAPEAIARARAAGRSEDLLRHWIAANSLHAIDLLRYFGGNVRARHLARRPDPQITETSLAALIEFESGAIGQYTAHWGSPGRWSASLYGRGVSAFLTPFESGVLRHADGREEAIAVDDLDVRFKPGFYKQLEAFVATVRTGTASAPAPDLAEAARSMELADWLAGGVR